MDEGTSLRHLTSAFRCGSCAMPTRRSIHPCLEPRAALDDLSTLRKPLGVMANGNWYVRSDLQALPDDVAAQYDKANVRPEKRDGMLAIPTSISVNPVRLRKTRFPFVFAQESATRGPAGITPSRRTLDVFSYAVPRFFSLCTGRFFPASIRTPAPSQASGP
jgi:hypothetical protein